MTWIDIVGMVLLVLGVAVLVNPKIFANALEHIVKNPGLLMFDAVVELTLGLVFVFMSGRAGLSAMILKILGLILLVESATVLFMPRQIKQIAKLVHKTPAATTLTALILIVFGLLLLFT